MASMSAYPQLHQSTATSPVPESGYHIHSPNHLQLLQLQHMQHMQMHMSKAQTHVGNPQPGPAQAQAQAQQQYLDSHSQAYIAHQGPGIPPISSPGAAAADSSFVTAPAPAPATGHKKRKRKAESQDAPGNERLSKRLSLLNLEHNGAKLYIPVEAPSSPISCPGRPDLTMCAGANPPSPTTSRHDHRRNSHSSRRRPPAHNDPNQMMQLDDSRHKVYIYNIDDELSSSESEPEDGRLIMLPDLKKHLLANRMPLPIPPVVRPSPEGELAGMQLVLYREPAALTVPEADDSVRRAVVEARQRIRDRQKLGAEAAAAIAASAPPPAASAASGLSQLSLPTPCTASSFDTPSFSSSFSSQQSQQAQQMYAPDAMDMDVDMDID
ncbi:hypothetical protein BROUX41_005494 [Berkeleyomyces rouxiae]|uniref:uncharacterized protein n=1 Tax=Berkeleyomyces rouxiae TaxID=2035830 RepID=UPI003B78464F